MSRNLVVLVVLLALPVTALSGKKKKNAVEEKEPAAAAAPATDAPEAVVGYRHQVMEGAAKHMKAASMIVKGEITRPEDMVLHAAALHGVAKAVPTLFPKGTEPAAIASDSKPEVWTNWDDFLVKNQAYEDATAKLLAFANAGDLDGFKGQFREVGMSCGGCHDAYRVDED